VPVSPAIASAHADPAARDLALWLNGIGDAAAAARVREHIAASLLGAEADLAGPVGERNLYALHPRGRVLLLARTRNGLIEQLGVALASGNEPVVAAVEGLQAMLPDLPESVANRIRWSADWTREAAYAGALIEGDDREVAAALAALADLPGPIVLPQAAHNGFRPDWLVEEVSTSINTTAAGGDASLMVLPIS
jgi:RHH-type proline utilization regulon transcriptional repressor/proline dehydrogenase/delta 1-pyrroline-5-carboxylate dehydrogenase